MCGAAPASVRKTAAPFSHARVLDIRPAAGGRGRELGFCRRAGGLRERERTLFCIPSCFHSAPFDRDIPSVRVRHSHAQSSARHSLSLSVSPSFLWHSPLPILRLVTVSRKGLSPRLTSPSFLPCSLGGVSSFFSSPKNLLKTFSLQAGGGPPPPSASVRPPSPLCLLSRCPEPLLLFFRRRPAPLHIN